MLTPLTVNRDNNGKPCGASHIPRGRQCSKGARRTKLRTPKEGSATEKTLAVLGGAAAVGGLLYGASGKSGTSASRIRSAEGLAVVGGGLGLIGASAGMYGRRTKNAAFSEFGAVTALAGGTLAGAAQAERSVEQQHQKRMERLKNFKVNFNQEFNTNYRAYTRSAQSSSEDFRRAREAYRQRYGQNQTGAGGPRPGAGRAGTDPGSQGKRRPGRPNAAVPDPFGTLGVSEKASDTEIKRAWMKFMRQHHPDVGGDVEQAKLYNAAYQEILRRRGRTDSVFAAGFAMDWDLIDL